MSAPRSLDLGPAGEAAVRNLRRLRLARRWSALDLEAHVKANGGELNRSVITNLENGRRGAISVDELAAVARAFRVEPWSLTTDEPVCLVCRNEAPTGFACITCGRREAGS